MARVTAIRSEDTRIGFMKGEIKVPDDFDTMGAKTIERLFYGKA